MAIADIATGQRSLRQRIMQLRMPPVAPILIVTKQLPPGELAKFLGHPFDDMIKFVVDLERNVAAIGGELHADAEVVLLDSGSEQDALWGGNYRPGRGLERCIEYTSLINIRPAQDNPSMVLQDPVRREAMRSIVFALIGRGEPLR